MDYQIENAYPAITLHDCQISKLEIVDNSTVFTFDEGYGTDAETKTKPHAQIIIPEDLSKDMQIVKSKMVRFIKGVDPIYISREISFQKFQKLIEKRKIVVVYELYEAGRLFWRGDIQKQVGKKKFKTVGFFEILIRYMESEVVYKYSV